MHALLSRNLYSVNEHKGAASDYDICDPKSNSTLLACREEGLGLVKRALRTSPFKRMTSFAVAAKATDGETLFRVRRGPAFFRSDVQVVDANDRALGSFVERWSMFGCEFDIVDDQGESRYVIRGNSSGWDYRITRDADEIARVKRKPPKSWSGWFSSVDNYIVEISSRVAKDHPVRPLVLAAVLCIDMVLND